jgi:diguanylate cyclase (GGDEF)-like protein/PAS domain S-box-containing protein
VRRGKHKGSDKPTFTILNVDDNEATRYATSRILRQAGFEVREAANGAEALRLVEENPDLVVLDVNLPDMSGFEICQRMKADTATSLIPALMLSATYMDDQSRVKGLESGADGYLTMPVEPPVLIAYVKALLRIRQAREALRESEQRYRHLFEGIGDAVMVYSSQGRFVDCNEAALQWLGYSREELLRLGAADIVHPDFHQVMRDNQERVWAGEATIVESAHRCKDGRVIPVEVHARRIEYEGRPTILAVVRDITERKRVEEALRALLLIDELTGLYNRRGFVTLGRQQLKAADRAKRKMLLLFADFNHLKQINDTFGHPEGDRALIEVAHAFRETFRQSDIMARIGGDEFVVLAIETDSAGAEALTTRLQENLEARNARGDLPYELSLSAGVARYDSEHPCSIDELLARADRLMYEQKRGAQQP